MHLSGDVRKEIVWFIFIGNRVVGFILVFWDGNLLSGQLMVDGRV